MNGPSYLEQYARAILSGEITAGRRIKQQMRHLLDKIEHPEKYEPYIFDPAVADHHIEFIEKFCKQSQGRRGEPLTLELFQKARLEAIFGFVDKNTGYRQYNEVLIIEGRKNGKTTETAAIELDMLLNDGAGAPEIYNIATRLEQAKKGFVECWNMQRNSTAIRKLVRKRQNDLFCAVNLGFIKPLAADTNGLDGLNAQMVVIDELAAIKNRDIYDLMKQSMGAGTRPQPLLFCMDDILFIGAAFKDVKKAARLFCAYLRDELGLEIKPIWHVKALAKEPIDIMGFVIRRDRTTVRARIFVRARRQFLRAWAYLETGGYITIKAARRIISYRGYFSHTDSVGISAKLHIVEVSRAASNVISAAARAELAAAA